jgi:serine/threonine-protein kinase RsbT
MVITMNLEREGKLRIDVEADLVTVRKKIREIAAVLGFALTDLTRILTAASELTRNIYRFAGTGYVEWHMLEANTRVGIELIFEDHGPGIADVEQALRPGYTTGGGMGLGLPGAKRLMDEMEIKTEVGRGTTVIVRKWVKR